MTPQDPKETQGMRPTRSGAGVAERAVGERHSLKGIAVLQCSVAALACVAVVLFAVP